MLNKRETTAVASATRNSGKEPRSCQIADISNSAIQTILDVANHAVTGLDEDYASDPIDHDDRTAKVTRLSLRAIVIDGSLPRSALYFGWRVLTVSSFRANNICDLLFVSHEPTLATPISCSSSLSSMCQLSVMRPFLDLDEVVAMNGIGWPLLASAEPAVKWPVKVHMHGDVVAGDDHLLHRDLKNQARRRGSGAGKGGPSGPCGRPGGSV